MNKKSYITPQTEQIIIANDAILAGSLTGNGMSGTYGDESEEDRALPVLPVSTCGKTLTRPTGTWKSKYKVT